MTARLPWGKRTAASSPIGTPVIGQESAERAAADARIRAVFEALPMGILVVGGDGIVRDRNRAARSFDGHGGVLVAEAVETAVKQVQLGRLEPRTVELFGPPKRVLVVEAHPLDDGDTWVSIDDISARVHLDTVRTDFVANISHEMKTPVGAMAVLAEAISDSDDITTMRRLADKMVDEAHRVSRSIDDLLELSRIELGGAEAELVAIELVVAEAMQRCAEFAAQQKIAIEFDHHGVSAKVRGDGRQLVSAVSNLLDNAVKYSDPGSVVRVVARNVTDDRGGWLDIAVIDNGVGIPARDLERVFERFYRVDRARSRGTGGTGLGLAIVRHVATNHGGEVSAHSQEGEGSTFVLRIPLIEEHG